MSRIVLDIPTDTEREPGGDLRVRGIYLDGPDVVLSLDVYDPEPSRKSLALDHLLACADALWRVANDGPKAEAYLTARQAYDEADEARKRR
jgi:hypothetical protein